MNIMPYRYRLFYRFSIFSYKIMNNVFLPSICESITIDSSLGTSLSLRSAKIVKTIITRTKAGERKLSFFLSNFVNNVLKFLLNMNFRDFKTAIMVNIDEQVHIFNSCIPKCG